MYQGGYGGGAGSATSEFHRYVLQNAPITMGLKSFEIMN